MSRVSSNFMSTIQIYPIIEWNGESGSAMRGLRRLVSCCGAPDIIHHTELQRNRPESRLAFQPDNRKLRLQHWPSPLTVSRYIIMVLHQWYWLFPIDMVTVTAILVLTLKSLTKSRLAKNPGVTPWRVFSRLDSNFGFGLVGRKVVRNVWY